jgi:DNA-binding transcriptional MerR regulator
MERGDAITIGELAEFSGLTRRTLRILDEKGILSPGRAPNGYRLYGADQVKLARAVRDMREAGLSAGEIARILAVKTGRKPEREKMAELARLLAGVQARLSAKRDSVDAAIAIVEDFRLRCEGRRRD